MVNKRRGKKEENSEAESEVEGLDDIPLIEKVRIIEGEYLKKHLPVDDSNDYTPTRGEILAQSSVVGAFLGILYAIFHYIVQDVLLHNKPKLFDFNDYGFQLLLQ